MSYMTIEVEADASLTYHTHQNNNRIEITLPTSTVRVTRDIEVPNPNLDAYFCDPDMLWLADDLSHGFSLGGDDVSELTARVDFGSIYSVEVYMSPDSLVDSASMRAAEDRSTVKDVLTEWSRGEFAPDCVRRVAEKIE
jgi:hypothetical protein